MKRWTITSVDEHVEKWEPAYTIYRNVKWHNTLKNSLEVPEIIK